MMMMIQHENSEKNNNNGLPSPAKTIASTTVAAEEASPQSKLNFLERAARRVARWPKAHFWVAIIVASALSAASMYFGDFYVTVDNVGWPSRGTLIANRHTQTKLINDNRKHLAKTNSAALWEELTTTVQVGWEFKHLEKEKKKESSNSNTEERRALQEAWSDKLQQEQEEVSSNGNSVQRSNLTTILKECDVTLYTNPDFVQRKRLWPVWKLQSTNASASVLDPPILKDLCDAEEHTQRLLEQEGLCFGCYGQNKCLPPYSPVLYARFMIPNGFVLDCQELAEQWGPYQAKTEQKWKECVGHMKRVGQDYLDNRGPCPSIFSPSLVDDHFDDTGKVRYTSSIFVTVPKLSEKYYELSDHFHRGSGDDHQLIEGTYDTQYMDFIAYYARDIVNEDMVLAVGSAMITTLAMLFHTQSPFLTLIGIIQIALSFPLAFGVYRFVFGLTFFPFLNLIGLFVVFALGADHVFVAVDKWKNARKEHPRATTEQVAIQALPSAGKAMILTTITTAVAFFGSALCVVAPIRLFAIFCGLLIVFDYILDVIVMFPSLVIYDGYRHQRNYCVDFRYHDPVEATTEDPKDRSERRSRNEAEEEKLEDEEDYYEDVDCGFKKEPLCDDTASESSGDPFEIPNPNLIQRILQSYYNVLHTWRWPVLVLSLAALGVCSYFATTLDVPVSSTDIQLLGDSVEYEQNRQWRKELLMSTLLQQSGSIAYLNWGLTPADTGDHDNPKEFSTLVLDESFDPSTEAAQIYLKEYCETMFVQEFAEPISDGYSCPFSQFDHWLELQASLPFEDQNATYVDHCDGAAGIPMPEDSFHACMSSWVVQVDHRDVLSWNGVVKVLTLPFLARVRFDSPNDELRDEWNLIENWVQAERLTAPIEVSGAFFSSFDFWFWDTSSNVYKTAIESGAIAIAVSALVILISSRSLTMTLFSAASVVYVLVSVASVMSAAGWTLGFLESICFTILIGLSADFVIHLSHAYTELPGDTDRHTRTKYALIHLGPSILAAGFTTLVGAAIMLFTTIHFFRLFAMVLFFTIVQATIGSFVVFLGITDCIGPANPTYAADCALSKISAWGKRQHNSEDTTKADAGVEQRN